MFRLILLLAFTPLFSCADGDGDGLVNSAFIKNTLTHKTRWSSLHAAHGEDLGAGMLYYGLVYANKAKLCVCLGSGDGFVPRVLRQAQRDLNLSDSKTILVDGNIGMFGRPVWLNQKSFFRQQYPEIEIIIDTTANVAKNHAVEWTIDYLHIDADRTVTGALQDFLDYVPYMSQEGTIILHDVGPGRPCAVAAAMIKEMGYPMVLYESLGTGIAVIRLKG